MAIKKKISKLSHKKVLLKKRYGSKLSRVTNTKLKVSQQDNTDCIVDPKLSSKIISLISNNKFLADTNDIDKIINENDSSFHNNNISDTVPNFNIENESFLDNTNILDSGITELLAVNIIDSINVSNSKISSSDVYNKLNPQVKDIYIALGDFLSRYKSGKMPKAFNVIPKIESWFEIIKLTNPLNWTSNAMYQAVHIFSSNISDDQVVIFYKSILLPSIRDQLKHNKKLNFHYYQSLKIAFFKPSSWFQGILFPLLEDNCTLVEALIVGSIISKVSIPSNHLNTAMIHLCRIYRGCTFKWSSASCYILNVLLKKKSSLFELTIQTLSNYFISFVHDKQHLPVIWHQSLLLFVQNYKCHFPDQIYDELRKLITIRSHTGITPSIYSELNRQQLSIAS